MQISLSEAFMNQNVKVALIYGSTRPGRLCDKVMSWAVEQVNRQKQFEIAIVDPGVNDPNVAARLSAADAFVVVTPEYNHGYPAPLKELLDSFGSQWHAKPVAFVSYGGISGGIRAVEQLRQVFVELHAMTIRESVVFPNVWEQFGSGDKPEMPERSERSMASMLRRLHWWAVALKIARSAIPYASAA